MRQQTHPLLVSEVGSKKRKLLGKSFLRFRAESGTRTRDLRITNALLYQLSYFGKVAEPYGSAYFHYKRFSD